MAAWYHAKDGEQVGPFENAELRNLAATGQLQPTDLIWREGLPQWVAASTVKGLFAAAPATPAARVAPPIRSVPAQASSTAPGREPLAALSPAARIDRTVSSMGALRLNNPTAYAGPTDIVPQAFDNGVPTFVVIVALAVFMTPCLIIFPMALVHAMMETHGHATSTNHSSSVPAVNPKNWTHGYSTTLLAGVDPKSQQRAGTWSTENGIVNSSGHGLELLAIAHQVPDQCDITMEFVRASGDEDIGLEIRRGDSTFLVLLGARHNSLIGVDTVDQQRLWTVRDTYHGDNLIPLTPAHHKVIIRMRNQSFDVILDDKHAFHTKPDYRKWALDPAWHAGAADPLALATYNSAADFISLRVDPPGRK